MRCIWIIIEIIRIMSKQFFVIAHNIRSLFNVGSIFRTSDAFGVTKIYLTGYTPTPEVPKHKLKIGKTALGAEDFVPWEYRLRPSMVVKDLRLQLPKISIVALENNTKSVPLNTFKPKFPIALVLGEEVNGIAKPLLALCDEVVEIPMYGKKESLNVSVAFGIAAYGLTK